MTEKQKKQAAAGILPAVILAAVLGCLWLLPGPGGSAVQIVQDGEVLYTFDLADMGDQTFDVEYEGRSNTIQIEGGRIRVLEAECPDQTCVHMGWLSSAAPIVCLPNHLVIEYVQDQELDAVVR